MTRGLISDRQSSLPTRVYGASLLSPDTLPSALPHQPLGHIMSAGSVGFRVVSAASAREVSSGTGSRNAEMETQVCQSCHLQCPQHPLESTHSLMVGIKNGKFIHDNERLEGGYRSFLFFFERPRKLRAAARLHKDPLLIRVDVCTRIRRNGRPRPKQPTLGVNTTVTGRARPTDNTTKTLEAP